MAKTKNLLFTLLAIGLLLTANFTPANASEVTDKEKQELKIGAAGPDSLRVYYEGFANSVNIVGYLGQLDSLKKYTSKPIDVSPFNKGTLYLAYSIDTMAGKQTTDSARLIIYNYLSEDIKGVAIDTVMMIGTQGSVALTLSSTAAFASSVSAGANSDKWYFVIEGINGNKKGRRANFTLFGTLNTGYSMIAIRDWLIRTGQLQSPDK